MKQTYLTLILLVFLLPCTDAQPGWQHQNPVNPIIGDRSYSERFGVKPTANTNNELRISTHLEYAEKILRAKDVSHLSPELRTKRIEILNLLHEYWVTGIFPHNNDFSERKPCFIDNDGRICAVGYLVEQTAGRAVAEHINDQFQYEELLNMHDPALDVWIANSGLTKEEFATIQPTYEGWYDIKRRRHHIGLRGGMAISSVSTENFAIEANPQWGFTGGITYQTGIKKYLYFGSDLLYEQRGFQTKIQFTDEIGNVVSDAQVEFHYDYLSLPIRIGLQSGKSFYGFCSVGLAPALLAKAYYISPTFDNNSNVSGSASTDISDELSSFDLSGVFQVGGGYKTKNVRWSIFGCLDLQHGLKSITTDDYFSESSIKNRGVGFSIGMRYLL